MSHNNYASLLNNLQPATSDSVSRYACVLPLRYIPLLLYIEAYLLLETARADRQVWVTRQALAHQIIHRNTLTLQYNRLMLEKAQGVLCTVDRFVGKVRTTIRQSGVTAAFEHAMREDYSLYTGISGKIHSSQTTPLLI